MALRCLIVDDEPLGRERIRNLLAGERDFLVVREADTGEEAVAAIHDLALDVVFLDIQMPELDGFGVIERVGVERMPLTVFVTAFDQYAVRAFEAHAMDYLLKPFDHARFQRTLDRIRAQSTGGRPEDLRAKLSQLLQSMSGAEGYPGRLIVRSGPRHIVVSVDEIQLITAEGNYLRIHTDRRTYLLRDTMAGMADRLDPGKFVRIHRSTIVRISSIAEVESVFQGEYVVVLRDGKRFPSSRAHREQLERAIDLKS